MTPNTRWLLVFALALAGCAPKTVRPPLPVAAATASPASLATTPPLLPASTLTGVVRVPMTVGNGGTPIIANNGANYRLATVEQRPLGGKPVALTDAAGHAVLDAAGKPLVATTDATGAYRFSATLPPGNLVATVDLGKAGALTALVPHGVSSVDIELVSTLTSGYILSQYVKGDPAVLDRLTADLEAAARAKAANAITAVPDDLTPAKVVAAVASLRQADRAFDDQMAEIEKALVVGQADLGNGRKATDVALGFMRGLLVAPDGRLIFACPADKRIWALGKDGTLTSLGQLPGLIKTLQLDDQGRLLVLEERRVLRQAADGSFTELWSGPDQLTGLVPEPGDNCYVLVLKGAKYELWTTSPKALVQAFDEPGLGATDGVAGRDAAGRLYFSGVGTWRYDPATKKLEGLSSGAETVDTQGNRFQVATDGTVTVVAPDGTSRALSARLPDASYTAGFFGVGALGPNGEAYFGAGSTGARLYRLDGPVPTLLAGSSGGTTGTAGDLPLLAPAGLAIAPDNALVVSDPGAHRLLRVAPDQQVAPLAEPPAATTVRLDANGRPLWIEGGHAVRTLAADGTIATRFSFESTARRLNFIDDVSPAADGGLDVAVTSGRTLEAAFGPPDPADVPPFSQVLHVPPAGEPVEVARSEALAFALGRDAAGTLVWLRKGRLQRGDQVWLDDPGLAANGAAGLAVDARGHVYYADVAKDAIMAVDPAAKSVTVLAGHGGSRFTGDTPDDGVSRPRSPAIAPNGDLLFVDVGHRQIKRLPAPGDATSRPS